jgi:hypothetical protein
LGEVGADVKESEDVMALIFLTIIPLIAYWIAYKVGKFWAQLLINCVAFLLPDVVPLVDEMGMTLVSVAGTINRRLMPKVMRIVYWLLGIVAVIALIVILCLAAFAD